MKAASIFALVLLVATAALMVKPSYSYVPDYTAGSGGAQPDRWDFSAFPVTWNLNPATGKNISGSRNVADVMAQAFATWQAAPNTSLQITRGADSSTTSQSSSASDVNLICFVCSDADFSKDSTTLAVTITTTANGPGVSDGHGGTTKFAGQLIKADMVFNPSTQFSTDGTSGQNLQTVATHEAGHFFGLDHSAVVRAVMFPAASSIVQLSWDDVAGISMIYPKSPRDLPTGTISGTVRLGASGIFGAHVYAESTTGDEGYGGNIRKSPIGALTRPDGTYTIQGLPPDSYIVTAEPLDGPVSGSDISSYPKAFGQPSVNTSFTTRWH
jgi:Matrixin